MNKQVLIIHKIFFQSYQSFEVNGVCIIYLVEVIDQLYLFTNKAANLQKTRNIFH
jgi:hypothetical protein